MSAPASVLAGNYHTLLRVMHERARPRAYLEIGVFHGASLRLALPSTRAIGVDPRPSIDGPLPRGFSVFAETSDAFFARPDVAAITGSIDVAFIDGLHLYEQALRDFVNLEPLMNPGGVILVHDCYPPHLESAGRTMTPGCWAGDVWKLLFILAEHRPDLTITVSNVGPSGIGIVTGLDPISRVLADGFDDIVADYADLPFQWWPETRGTTFADVADQFPVFRPRRIGDVTHELRRKLGTLRRVVRNRIR